MIGSILGFFAYGALFHREVAGRDVLEVGSLNINGSVRPLVEARNPASYVGVDVVDGPGVDKLCDVADLVATFGPDSFDVVVSTECLEHVADWQLAVAQMTLVLRPGGVLVWTTRSPGFLYHHPPDRWRYTPEGMAEILHRLGLDTVLVCSDPEPNSPGVFCKARKPASWTPPPEGVLDGVEGVTSMRRPQPSPATKGDRHA
jgi:SAM-dependent methyltransferase